LAAEEALHFLVVCDWLENQFEHRHLAKGVRSEPGNQIRRDGVYYPPSVEVSRATPSIKEAYWPSAVQT
jgi:hypothetical protein